jgi:hypothetical protein
MPGPAAAKPGHPSRNAAHPPSQTSLWVGVSFGVLAAWILAWALGAPPWLGWLLPLAWFGSAFWLFFRDLPGQPRR